MKVRPLSVSTKILPKLSLLLRGEKLCQVRNSAKFGLVASGRECRVSRCETEMLKDIWTVNSLLKVSNKGLFVAIMKYFLQTQASVIRAGGGKRKKTGF